MRTLLNLIVIALAALMPMSVCCSEIKFRTIQTRDGLSNNHVNTVFRDSQGFMWFGSAAGLNRYDGYSIKTYQSSHTDTTCLHDNYIQTIQEDRKGNLWICAGDRYSVFNPRTERFHWLKTSDYRGMGLSRNPNLIKLKGDTMYLSVPEEGLYRRCDNKTVRICSLPFGEEITDVAVSPTSGQLVAVSNTGMLHIINEKHAGCVKSIRIPGASVLHTAYSLFIDNIGRIWIYCVNGLTVYDSPKDRWIDGNSLVFYKGHSIRAINQDNRNNIWIGYDNDGIEVLDPAGESMLLKSDSRDMYSLGNNSIKCIYKDCDGGIWIGTYKKGVSVYYPSEYKFSFIDVADVNCITSSNTSGQEVFLGTDHSGLLRYNLLSGVVGNNILPVTENIPAIVCLAYSPDGTLWIGTYKYGAYRYDGNSFIHLSSRDGLAFDNVWAIVPEDDGSVWFGTLGGGIQLYNPKNHTFRNFNTANSGLTSDHINTMARGKDGMIYIGTTDGVFSLNPASLVISPVMKGRQKSEHFGSLNINQIIRDSRGLLWVGTREGLSAYDMQRDSIYDIQLKCDIHDIFIDGIIEGVDKSIWVTSDDNLFNIKVERDNLTGNYSFIHYIYGKEDGLSGATFNQRSMWLLQSGIILAGNSDGFLTIDPEKLYHYDERPRVRFTDLYIRNREIIPQDKYNGKVILPESLCFLDEISLAYDQNDFVFSVATDSYISSNKGEYEYMLEGFDKEWRKCAKGTNKIGYTNIPPGRYTLKVRLNVAGIPSAETQSELGITVNSPWWATWWMTCIYILAAIIALCVIFHLMRKKERKIYLEKQKAEEQKREEEINQLKFKFFTNISHDLRTPLTLILSPIESMLNESKNERDIKRLSTVKRNANRLLYLVNQLLDFRKNEMAGLRLNLISGNIVQIAEKALEAFADMAEQKNINLNFESDKDVIDISFDNDKLTKAIINLLSNAMRYTSSGGDIKISISHDDEIVRIAVIDTGKGISDKDKKHIFERFYMSDDQPEAKTGTGIGLSLVYEYVKLHEGVVKVSDNLPNGAIFTIEIPTDLDKRIPSTSSPIPPKPEDNAQTQAESRDLTNDVERNHSVNDGKPKVLFVDDNHDLVDFLRDEFSNEFDVVCAYDGEEALQKVGQYDFDLIVSDIMMPKVDGIKLGRLLKGNQNTADIPLIMLTAKQDVSSVIEGLTLGAEDYITKPFNNNVLALKMRMFIKLKKKGMKRSKIEPTPADIQITSLDEQLVEKAVKYVDENMSRSDLTVEELSAHLGMSRVNLYKKLLPLTGKTPIEFIRILRLKRAAQYLRESQLNVSEIAYRIGFNNPKYFSKYFKEEFGISPSEYQDKEGK